MRGKFNIFTIISVRAPMEENDELVYGKCNQRYQGIPARYKKYSGRLYCKNRKRLIC
jgi:hypothetical protein